MCFQRSSCIIHLKSHCSCSRKSSPLPNNWKRVFVTADPQQICWLKYPLNKILTHATQQSLDLSRSQSTQPTIKMYLSLAKNTDHTCNRVPSIHLLHTQTGYEIGWITTLPINKRTSTIENGLGSLQIMRHGKGIATNTLPKTGKKERKKERKRPLYIWCEG